ncbi:MAG TPA: helix-turn-helix transcriptional regulator [Allosphingosinicella sp.]|nr:helix-turn-helix transcriptional regulator [Allosphingosinicella sp.]
MIAGCIDRMRRDSCGGCERRDACAEIFPFLLKARGRPAAAGLRGAKTPAGAPHPFFTFLGEVARAFEVKAAERKAPPRASPFRAEVEARLEPLLASGEVGIERLARDLGCSRQTLYRRLKSEGITYEQLLDGLRRRLALRFMREELSVKEAAYRLGFSDPAAFSRAFKRWTGSSPSAARSRH